MTSTGVIAAEALADALVAAMEQAAFVPVAEQMLERFQGPASLTCVTLREAADELEVSLPTVRNWIRQGLLVEVEHAPRVVTIPSLALVLAARRRAGISAADPRPAARILDELRDQALLDKARRVSAQTSPEDFLTYSQDDLAELDEL